MEYLKIQNFKCFQDIDIPLGRLTVLAGANGNGKSTSVQALLYLRHTIELTSGLEAKKYVLEGGLILNPKIPLNGPFLLCLGDSAQVNNRQSDTDQSSISLFSETEEITANYQADTLEPELYLNCTELIAEPKNLSAGILLKEFYYLNAERLGPRISQQIRFGDFHSAGWQGEYVAHLISLESGYFKIVESRLFPGTTNQGIEFQVNEWLKFIMPGVGIRASSNNATFSAQIRMDNGFNNADSVLATNTGFGISYLLPIIATGLIAAEGSYFIVENPEAHLHPSAQSRVGRFLAKVAKAGVNVIVETHSDHIINGMQIAVASGEIDADLITINYFSHTIESAQPELQTITLSEKGELSDWPQGFFDQAQIDFAHLLNLRKK